jgi:hypothetical protein
MHNLEEKEEEEEDSVDEDVVVVVIVVVDADVAELVREARKKQPGFLLLSLVDW